MSKVRIDTETITRLVVEGTREKIQLSPRRRRRRRGRGNVSKILTILDAGWNIILQDNAIAITILRHRHLRQVSVQRDEGRQRQVDNVGRRHQYHHRHRHRQEVIKNRLYRGKTC